MLGALSNRQDTHERRLRKVEQTLGKQHEEIEGVAAAEQAAERRIQAAEAALQKAKENAEANAKTAQEAQAALQGQIDAINNGQAADIETLQLVHKALDSINADTQPA